MSRPQLHLNKTLNIACPISAFTLALVACLTLMNSSRVNGQQTRDSVTVAQLLGKTRPAIKAQPDSLIVCEGEEFQPDPKSHWQAKPFGENYYAATFANSFLSRKAFLGAPENCDESTATIRIEVPAAGRYLALVRYEAAYRFETQFRLRIEQGGKRVLDRLYGARDNLKIWAFRQKLQKEVGWSWGAVENIVWEGHDAFVNLKPGVATLTLVAGKQPEPAARRNIDLVMLTTDVEQVKTRIEKENYLPLDGMLTQSGDVWLRVTNRDNKPITFQGKRAMGAGAGNWQQHSPYWVHIRNWKAPSVKVEPGKTSEWVEVGGVMDSLSDGQWFWNGDGKYKAEFALKDAKGKLATIASFDGEGDLTLAADADTRYTRRLRKLDDVLYDLLESLQEVPKRGRTPRRTIIYASTFTPLDSGKHAAAVTQFKSMFGLADTKPDAIGGRGYIDVRSVRTDKLEEYCKNLGNNAKNVAVVSLGDEIRLPSPRGAAANDGFRQWLKQQGVKPNDVDPVSSGDWDRVVYSPDSALKKTKPGLFYWSQRYLYHFGIQTIKQRTDILRRHLPNASVGANYSPHYPQEHMFLGEVFKWVSVFREDGMTMPWSEDYIWQVAVGTPQMNNINLDLFRAALRHKPGGKIHYYVMPHMPNNTPNQWRRLFYGAIGHGMKIVNLFEFRPVQVAYTENHVDHPDMYKMILGSFRELGTFEDIVQDGQIRAAEAALWFSETGDIWGDSRGSFAAAKRGLYIAIRQQQIPLDFVVEQDALDGTLSKYKVLYLTDAHVSTAASKKIADWVKAGGNLFATAGAGMFDELNRPNKVLRSVLGVEQTKLEAPENAQIIWLKQDLPFTSRIAGFSDLRADVVEDIPAFSIRSRIKLAGAKAEWGFSDNEFALTKNVVGKGQTIYCAFLPSLTYFKPAIPKRPVDRGATDDSMVHFLPTEFDKRMANLVASPASEIVFPVRCSEPLVENTVIQSKHGTAIPLVNWSGKPVHNLKVTVSITTPKSVSLASGGPLKVDQGDNTRVYTFDLDVADVLIFR